MLGLLAVLLAIRHVPAWPPPGVTRLAGSDGCKRPDWSPDGKAILFDRWPNGGVGYIDIASGQVHNVSDNGFEPAWFPDGRRILVMRQAPRSRPAATATYAIIYTSAGEQIRALDDGGITFWHARPDAHRDRIYGVTAPTARIGVQPGTTVVVTMDPRDGKTRIVTREGISHPSRGVRWAPDGRWAAYRSVAYSATSYHHVISVSQPDGTGVREMPVPGALLSDPAWSPDGKWLAVVAVGPSPGRRVVDWANSAAGGSRAGMWLGDLVSKWVGAAPRTIAELRLIRADGRATRRIVSMGATTDCYSAAFATNAPAWSPDGRRIAVAKDGAIWIVPVQGVSVGRSSR